MSEPRWVKQRILMDSNDKIQVIKRKLRFQNADQVLRARSCKSKRSFISMKADFPLLVLRSGQGGRNLGERQSFF